MPTKNQAIGFFQHMLKQYDAQHKIMSARVMRLCNTFTDRGLLPKDFGITLGNTIHTNFYIVDMTPNELIKFTCHECKHLLQNTTDGFAKFYAGYANNTSIRANYEIGAYACTIEGERALTSHRYPDDYIVRMAERIARMYLMSDQTNTITDGLLRANKQDGYDPIVQQWIDYNNSSH